MATYVIEVTEFNSEDICDLRGRLEAKNGQNPSGTIITQILELQTASQLCGASVKASDFGAVGQGFKSSLRHLHL